MSGQPAAFFERKIVLRAYFANANGIKDGAPVTLEGVTIGNVIHVKVVPARDPHAGGSEHAGGRSIHPGPAHRLDRQN